MFKTKDINVVLFLSWFFLEILTYLGKTTYLSIQHSADVPLTPPGLARE